MAEGRVPHAAGPVCVPCGTPEARAGPGAVLPEAALAPGRWHPGTRITHPSSSPWGRTCDDFSSPFPPCWLLALSPPAGLFNHCPSKPTHFRSCKQEEMVEPSLQPLSVDLAPVGMFWLFEGVGRRKWAACAPASRSWGLASRGPAVR